LRGQAAQRALAGMTEDLRAALALRG
jgi:hypothetical protein